MRNVNNTAEEIIMHRERDGKTM